MKFRTKRMLSFLICLFVAIFTVVITINGVINGAGSGQLGEDIQGLGYFKAFTMDGNIFSAITLLIVGYYDLRWFFTGRRCAKAWVTRLQLMGATSAAVIFLMVFLFLVPMKIVNGENFLPMINGDMIFLHILNPILVVIEFVFFRWRRRIKVWECLLSVLPLAIYDGVYGFMVFVVKEWNDFYGFTFGGDLRWGMVSSAVTSLMAFLVSFLLAYARGSTRRSGGKMERTNDRQLNTAD